MQKLNGKKHIQYLRTGNCEAQRGMPSPPSIQSGSHVNAPLSLPLEGPSGSHAKKFLQQLYAFHFDNSPWGKGIRKVTWLGWKALQFLLSDRHILQEGCVSLLCSACARVFAEALTSFPILGNIHLELLGTVIQKANDFPLLHMTQLSSRNSGQVGCFGIELRGEVKYTRKVPLPPKQKSSSPSLLLDSEKLVLKLIKSKLKFICIHNH